MVSFTAKSNVCKQVPTHEVDYLKGPALRKNIRQSCKCSPADKHTGFSLEASATQKYSFITLAPIFRLRLPQKRSSDVLGLPDDAVVTRRDDVDRVFVERDFVRLVDSAEM